MKKRQYVYFVKEKKKERKRITKKKEREKGGYVFSEYLTKKS